MNVVAVEHTGFIDRKQEINSLRYGSKKPSSNLILAAIFYTRLTVIQLKKKKKKWRIKKSVLE